MLTRKVQHDATGNQIHALSQAGHDRLSFRRLAGDLVVLDKSSLIVFGNGREGKREMTSRRLRVRDE